VRDLYPDYVEAHSAYELLADAYLKKGDKEAAASELDRYARRGGRNPAAIKKQATLLEEAGRRKEAAAALTRLLWVDPLDEEVHRRLGELWLSQGNAEGAVREFSAALSLKPLDQAASRFNLARAYRAASRPDIAKEQLLLALEAAPGFRPAQKMLLELSQ
jgi:tetratricopeptide (TPR) repeat protein